MAALRESSITRQQEAHPGEEGKAMALVAAQFVKQMTLSGLQGAISGGVMGGGATAYAGIQNRGQGQGAGRTVQAGAVAQGAVTPQALPIAPAAQSAGNSPQDILAELNGPVAQSGAAARGGTAPQALPVAPAINEIVDFVEIYSKIGNEGAGGFAEQGGVVPQELPVANAGQAVENANGGVGEGKLFDNLDDYLANPNRLENATPNQMYKYLQDNGYSPQPLSGGGQAGKLFTEGGGFKVNWGGDRILQYHPAGGHHGGLEYWKISSGLTGTIRYDMFGNIILK